MTAAASLLAAVIVSTLWRGPFLLAHAGVSAYAMTHFPTGRSRLRGFAILGIIALGGALTALGIAEGWRISETFQPPSDLGRSSLNAYPVFCLAVGLGEALAAWRRSPYRRKE